MTRQSKPSVAILVDDLVAWFDADLQPSGIQRVAVAILDTALASPDIEAWLGVLDGEHIVAVDRARLQQVPIPRRLVTAGLGKARSSISGLPLGHAPRVLAKAAYRRASRAIGPKRRTAQASKPDLVLVPGTFWAGDWSRSIGRIAKKLPVRVMVYDLFPLTNPEWVVSTLPQQMTDSFREVAPHVDRIVAFGDTPRRDISRYFPDVVPKLCVAVPHLAAHAPRRPAKPAPIAGPYLLVVGTVEPRKNVRLVLDAWKRTQPRLGTGSLVIAGRRGWNTEELETEIARDRHHYSLIRIARVSDERIDALYAGATATVHASWAEGFGLPARESIARGVPALMSSTIPRDGLTYGFELFDPTNHHQLAALMETAIRHPSRYEPVHGWGGTGWEPVVSALVE